MGIGASPALLGSGKFTISTQFHMPQLQAIRTRKSLRASLAEREGRLYLSCWACSEFWLQPARAWEHVTQCLDVSSNLILSLLTQHKDPAPFSRLSALWKALLFLLSPLRAHGCLASTQLCCVLSACSFLSPFVFIY